MRPLLLFHGCCHAFTWPLQGFSIYLCMQRSTANFRHYPLGEGVNPGRNVSLKKSGCVGLPNPRLYPSPSFRISKASLVPKNARFNHTPHNYEIRLENNSTLDLCEEDNDTAAIPAVQYRFRPISDIETCEAGTFVDILAVVESVEQWQVTEQRGASPQMSYNSSLFCSIHASLTPCAPKRLHLG